MTSQPRRDPHLDRRRVTEPPNLDARVERGWARLEGAPSAPHRASAWWIGGAALAAGAAAVALVLLRPAPEPAAWAGQVLVTEDEPVEVRLRDGSTVAADRGATIHRVRDEPSSTVLRMESGSATYDVRPDAARAFVVWAGDVEVRVIGTRFRVAIEDEGTIAVRVERGGVDVRRGSEVVRVRAGESRRYPPRAGPAEEPGLDVDPGPPEEPRPAQVDDVAPRAPEAAGARPQASAARLLAAAAASRRAGRMEDAARAYQRLVEEHPSDPRAPLAALELGRLRMDVLRQPAPAAAAFRFAARRGRGTPIGEDAMARLVAAHAAAGQTEACRRAREAYLRAFPRGSHRARVASGCPRE